MRMNWIFSALIVTTAVSAAGAQSGKNTEQPMRDTMSMTYKGCVDLVNHGGTFLLTHFDDATTTSMPGEAMKDAGTMKDADTMKDGDTMKPEQATMDAKMDDGMTSRAFVLAGSDLRKHVGQKVSVTGTVSHGSMGSMRQDLSTLSVKTLKVIAKSCSEEVKP